MSETNYAYAVFDGRCNFAVTNRLWQYNYRQTASCPISVVHGDEITLRVYSTKNGYEDIFRRFLCFGCTVSTGS